MRKIVIANLVIYGLCLLLTLVNINTNLFCVKRVSASSIEKVASVEGTNDISDKRTSIQEL
jgi:hypothetical protein